ncbi:hypothetical protein [Pendulispora albinea]|uniref:Uncharacterized protein n=1 Tax=Pendulispora albinea TaxID=2741071 RepID=A0ABZ2LV92_9BACT
MSKPAAKKLSELGLAAAALDAELARFEGLAQTALQTPLNSEKNIERAARATMDAAACQNRVAERVQSLVAAVAGARDRQQATAERVLARAQEIQRRGEEVTALMKRFALLGVEAHDLVGLIQKVHEPGAAKEDVLALIADIEAKMSTVVSNSEEVAKAALSIEMSDIARQADSIRQQLHSAKNRLKLLGKSL